MTDNETDEDVKFEVRMYLERELDVPPAEAKTAVGRFEEEDWINTNENTYRYGYSESTDTWYRVTDWEALGDGKIRAISKERVDREEVPQEWVKATNERGYNQK